MSEQNTGDQPSDADYWYALGVKDGRDGCHVELDAIQARCDELEAAARDACEQLKSLAYASHKATGRPLNKRPRTKMLQRPEKVRDNLLAVRKVLRSVVDGCE